MSLARTLAMLALVAFVAALLVARVGAIEHSDDHAVDHDERTLHLHSS